MKQTTLRRNAFTLVEMLVAIAVLSILLAVVFVPLRLAINSYHVGQAQTSTQNAAQATLDDMERDFRRAVYVFPNTALTGVTDKAPYTSNKINVADTLGVPYIKSTYSDDRTSPQKGVCDVSSNAAPFSNTSRIDMILARRATNGQITLPPQPTDSIVTYYARRQDITRDYDPVDNPIALFRAEMPYRSDTGLLYKPDGSTFVAGTGPDASNPANVDLSSERLSCGMASKGSNRGSLWLEHNRYGEANLEPLVQAGNGVQTAAIPRGVGLVASQAYRLNSNLNPAPTPPTTADAPLVPDTSFQLSDTNGDGKINQVAVSLALETFDSGQGANVNSNGQPKGQIVRARRVFDLPNVR